MTKFCVNCGTYLDYGTGNCPRCDEIPNLKQEVEVVKTRLKLTVDVMKECEKHRKIGEERWRRLRTWLSNLLLIDTTTKTDKKGIQIALNIMDRIEEDR